jgi:hypothetical protein
MAILSANILCWMRSLADNAGRWNGDGERIAIPQLQNLHIVHTGKVGCHASVRQTIIVVAGTAWISVGGQDYVVQASGSLHLPCDPYPALISSVAGQRVIYQLV